MPSVRNHIFPQRRQLKSVPFPTDEWPRGDLPSGTDAGRLHAILDEIFGEPQPEHISRTHAVTIVRDGRLLVERYADGVSPEDTQPSWSMAKSFTHALCGTLVRDGKLDIHAPAPVPEWTGDARHEITIDQLFRMSSGLKFTEDYVDAAVSDVIEMLMGKGIADCGAFAAAMPLAHEPNTVWSYSSGTTNIISRIIGDIVGRGDAYHDYMKRELLDPLGITSAAPKFDEAGNFIGSSYIFCTPKDFAKFGLFCLRDGVWDGVEILPDEWIEYGRMPTKTTDTECYGAHFWLARDEFGTYACTGYQGQLILIIPALDMVITRSGDTAVDKMPNVRKCISDIIQCFVPNHQYRGIRIGEDA